VWLLVGLDLSLAGWHGAPPEPGQVLEVLGEPVLAGLYGPFESAEDAEAHRPLSRRTARTSS
jgi:hypothetical protein